MLTSLDTCHSLVTFVVVALAISSRFDELFLKVMSLSLKISFNNSFVKFSGALFFASPFSFLSSFVPFLVSSSPIVSV